MEKRKRSKVFWEDTPLEDLTKEQWEALCDGCGRCCLHKYEDEDKKIYYTDVACKLLDMKTCRCSNYQNRQKFVADCLSLTPSVMPTMNCLPPTCAYRLRYEGKQLYDWHYLKSGSKRTVHEAGISVRGRVVSEDGLSEDEIGERIVRWPMTKAVRKR